MSKKTASTKKAASKKVVAKKAAAPKKKVVARKAAAPKKKPVAKTAAAPKKKVVAKKAAAPKKKVVAKKVAAPKKKVVAKKAAAPKKKPVAKAAPAKPKAVVAAAPPPRSSTTLPAPNPVKTHAWKDVSVTLDGDVHKVIFFDWTTLSQGTRDPSPTARFQPGRNPFSWVEEFDEYIVGHWLDPVDEGDWEPIAVVGLGHASTTESFAEANNRGFLAVVKGGGSFPAGTVLWLDGPRYAKDQPFIVGPHLDALQITRR